MQQPTDFRPTRRGPRVLLAGLGVVALAAGVLSGADAALAATMTPGTIGDLQDEFADGTTTSISLDQSLSGDLVLQTQTPKSLTLDLNGQNLSVNGIWLTSGDQTNGIQKSSLSIVDSHGGGSLTVVRAASNTANAAIEVDSGSTLSITDATVTASVAGGSTAAAIGGGSIATTQARTAGDISIDGTSNVTAIGSARGAAIGGGYLGANGAISVGSYATVTATSTGSGAAIGGGANPLAGAVGSVRIADHATVNAVASGSGSAIGGGLNGGGGTISVGDFASLTADASSGQVGIGDGAGSNQGTTFTTALQSSVVAKGGSGAGIGSAASATGNDTILLGGRSTVKASSVSGPGIGATGNTVSPTVSIQDSATVVASGNGGGAGIGAGDANSLGAVVTIADGASATVSAGPGASAIGGATAARFGSFSSYGSLTLPSGHQITVPVTAQLTSSGTFTNNGTVTVKGEFVNGGSITNNGTFTGNGYVTNSGDITQYGTFETAVEGRYFHIKYDSQGGSATLLEQYVFADTFRSVGLTLPSATPPSVGYFSGWNTSPDGTGGTLNDRVALSSLAPLSTATEPSVLRVYALYQLQPVLRTDQALPQGVVGTAYSASVAATSGTAPITYTYTGDLPAGLSIDLNSGLITGTPTTSGTFTMHLTGRNAAGPTTHDYTIQIVATLLHVTAPATPKANTRYLAGGRLDVTLSGLQANESYKVTVGGKSVATGRAPTNQSFSVRTTVPKTISDGTQTVRLTGADHALSATSTILTAAVAKALKVKLSVKKVKAKEKVSITVSKLYAGESVRVVIKGTHSKASVGKATSKGVYVLKLKSGLAKGKYKITITGAGTSRKATLKLTVH